MASNNIDKVRLTGTAVASGVAVGQAVILKPPPGPDKTRHDSAVLAAEKEIANVHSAIANAKKAVAAEILELTKRLNKDELAIFEAQTLMLDDPELLTRIENRIRDKNETASVAITGAFEDFAKAIERLPSDYPRARAADIRGLSARVLSFLYDLEVRAPLQTESVVEGPPIEKIILVGDDLSPSDIAQVPVAKLAGMISEHGSRESHFAILARSLSIPAIIGVRDATSRVQDRQWLGLDARSDNIETSSSPTTGTVYLNPNSAVRRELEHKREIQMQDFASLKKYIGCPSRTADAFTAAIYANIGGEQDIDIALQNDAEGVGLFRTEFLFLNRTRAPTEDEQFNIYSRILKKMGPRPTVIRTLDVGGDKIVPYLERSPELNPFLGLRGIRYSLKNIDLFKTQLRALLRASHAGNLSIMFPMVASVEEILSAKHILAECDHEHQTSRFKIGAMVEVPSAAICAEELADHVQFLSIGTNDLVQYLLAADRQNNEVASVYDVYHPAVLRTIHSIIKSGHKKRIPVAMCGDLAARPEFVAFLLACGLDEWSVNPTSVLRVRAIISQLRIGEIKPKLDLILGLQRSIDVKQYLLQMTPALSPAKKSN